MALTYVSPNWGHNAEAARSMAIAHYRLNELGWKGFDELDWAAALLKKYPEVPVILLACNIGKPASFNALTELSSEMSETDRHRLRDYIVGKLGLEELSCRRSGPGSGSCDRRSALYRCVEICLEWQ